MKKFWMDVLLDVVLCLVYYALTYFLFLMNSSLDSGDKHCVSMICGFTWMLIVTSTSKNKSNK